MVEVRGHERNLVCSSAFAALDGADGDATDQLKVGAGKNLFVALLESIVLVVLS